VGGLYERSHENSSSLKGWEFLSNRATVSFSDRTHFCSFEHKNYIFLLIRDRNSGQLLKMDSIPLTWIFFNMSWIPINGVALKLFFPAVSFVTENTMLELETWFKYMHIENSMHGLRAEWSVCVCVKHNTWYSTLRISLFRNISLYSYRNHNHCERISLDGRQRKIRLSRAESVRAKSIMLIKCMLDKEERGMRMYVCMYELNAKQLKCIFLQRDIKGRRYMISCDNGCAFNP